jgi:hypothetical protein
MTTTIAAGDPIASAKTNRTSGSTVDALTSFDEDLLLLDPHNDQVCVVPREHAKTFLQEANQMQSLVQKLVEARDNVFELEAKLTQLEAQRFPSLGDINNTKLALQKARGAYDAAYDQVKKELGEKGYLATSGDGKELLELLPLAKRKEGSKPKEWARKWTYVRADKVKSHIRSYKLSGADGATSQAKSFLRNGRIDTQRLKEQFSKLDPKLKAEWVIASDAGYLMPKVQAWAEQLNVKANANSPVQFSTEVHLFRYFAGCGAALEWSPRSGKVGGKLAGKAELNIAQGSCKLEGFLPSPAGWALLMTGAKSGKEFHIGVLRLAASANLSAGVGASVAAELAIEVDYSSATKLGAKGARKAKNTPTAGPKAKLTELAGNTGVNAGADLFAGARAGGEFKGALQYQSPEAGDKLEDMAAIGPKVEVQWGAGAAAALMVTYENGKFRFKAKAGVCLGPGAKGELGLEVDAKRVAAFLRWFFHALLNAGFEFLEIVVRRAYEAAVRLSVLLVEGVIDAYDDIQKAWRDFTEALDREDRRVALMERVLSDPPELRICPPESHGILLWHLSRHGKLTKTTHLAANSENWETLGRRKRAIIQVCRWAQCKSQFENMVQHMAQQGTKGSFADNYAHLLHFMEIGPGNSDYDDDLRKLYQRLPIDPPRGYAVAQNHTTAFLARATVGDSPQYAMRMQGLTLGDSTAFA